jgi:hypothetical protein
VGRSASDEPATAASKVLTPSGCTSWAADPTRRSKEIPRYSAIARCNFLMEMSVCALSGSCSHGDLPCDGRV